MERFIEYDVSMNAETINDIAKLIMHRLIARQGQVRRDASIVERARWRIEEIEKKSGARDFTIMWKELLNGDPSELRRRLVARDEESTWLRLTSPFAGITGLPLNDLDLRRRIWKDARRLLTMQSRNPSRHGDAMDRVTSRDANGFN